jgi:hypothetical protein
MRETYVHFAYAGTLHSFFYNGRLGNRIIQNLALSSLARKHNVRAFYDMEEECRLLGLQLFSGELTMPSDSSAVVLTEENFPALLDSGSTQSSPFAVRMKGSTSNFLYFQTAFFARKLQQSILPSMAASLFEANPFRARIGHNRDTCVHLRLGDRAWLPTAEPSSYAAAIGVPAHGGKVFISSDSPSHPLVLELVAKFGAEVLPLERLAAMQFLATCEHLVLSDGSFGWNIGSMSQALNASKSIRYVSNSHFLAKDMYDAAEAWVRY